MELLRGCYAGALLPLSAAVERLQGGAEGALAPPPPVQDGDPRAYRSLLGECVVGLPAEGPPPRARLSRSQFSSPREVVERVIQRICEQGKKNVLAFGYSLLDEGKCSLPGLPTVCSILPNNTTEGICQSVLWEKFLSRVGDELVMYLLEHCALFVLVSPTCCYQICGRPVYQLAVGTTEPSPMFFRQMHSRPTRNVLSRYLLGRLQSHRRYLGKAKWRKHKAETPGRDPQGGWCPLVGPDSTKSKPVTKISDCLVSRRRPCQQSSLTAVFLKRKREDCGEMNAKRMKIAPVDEGLDEQARDLSLAACKDQLIGGGGSSNVSGGSVRACSEDDLTAMKYVPQEHDSGAQTPGASFTTLGTHELVVCDGTLRADGEKEMFQNSSTNTKGGMGVRRVSPVQRVHAKNITADKYRKKDTLNSVGESSDKICTAGKIKMRDLLYSRRPWKERLPQSFVLNRLKGCEAGGQRLVEAVFLSDKVPKEPDDTRLPSCRQRKKRLPKRYRRVRGEFQELLRNHAKCPYPVMLKKHCPVLFSDKIGIRKQDESLARTGRGRAEDCLRGVSGGLCPFPETSDNSSGIGEHVKLSQKESEESNPRDSSRTDFLALLKQNSSPWQVYTFVRGCLERVVPATLWGSSHNKRRFYKNVKKFISLGRLDTFALQELLWKMRVNDCAWLRLTKERGHSVPASEHQFRTRLLSKFLFWLMDSYVAQLLWSFFYITEAEFQKNLLFFFRKAVWRKLQSLAVRSHLAKVRLVALSKEEIETLQQRRSVPLAAKLRFIPKKNELRPVVRLNSPVGAEKFCEKNRDKKVQYFNMQLKNLYSVLKYEQKKNPVLLGSSVFGKDNIYATWKKFVLKVLESNAQMPAFYFVKADVSGAYDTIPHRKVVEVIAQILGPDNKTSYCIRRYAVIIRTKNGQIIKRYRRHVSTLKDFIPDMALFVRHLQQTTSLRNAVVVEQGVYLKERCSDLFGFFLQLIHSNILKIENRYYVQHCGIPQGSILSTFLCSLCYGDMENKLLRGVQEDGLLMRLTDDFLLVTPHLAEAKTFLRTLATGIPEYGFSINPAKTMTNFPLDEAVDIPGSSEFKQLPAHSVFPWCGLLIDTQTLEVYCDYSSYACTSVRASLAFSFSSAAGVHMRNKLFVVLQLQCHHLFLDLQINSLKTVCINIYKIFLLQAYRFHACVLRLPFNQQIKNNPSFFLRIIADTASCGFSILKAKNAGIFSSATRPSTLPTFELVQWLCYHAFSVKLADHRVIYKCLLTPLKYCKMCLLRNIPKATMQLLQKVTEPWLCEDFKAILD